MDHERAAKILTEEAAKSAAAQDLSWVSAIDSFYKLCFASGEKVAGTHVAVLGTAILAKCVDVNIDVFALKRSDSSRAYSARGLSKGVLAPKARELDIHLGVTGPEPHQNSPYTGEARITAQMAQSVRGNARPAFEKLLELLQRLDALKDERSALFALRAFIHVCRRNGPRYASLLDHDIEVDLATLITSVKDFVAGSSDGGRRAQAVAAAVMDVFAGPDKVVTKRVNDPSRSAPGDVQVTSTQPDLKWSRSLEVRDKPVTHEDLIDFASRCTKIPTGEAVVLAMSAEQLQLDPTEAVSWAAQRGVTLTVFQDWTRFVREALHWGPMPTAAAAKILPRQIYKRLVEIEAPVASTEEWASRFPLAEP